MCSNWSMLSIGKFIYEIIKYTTNVKDMFAGDK